MGCPPLCERTWQGTYFSHAENLTEYIGEDSVRAMRQSITEPRCADDCERSSLVSRRLRAVMRRFSIGIAVAAVALLAQTSVSRAGTIFGFATNSQIDSRGQGLGEFGLSNWEDAACFEDQAAPSSAPQSPRQPVPDGRHEVQRNDAGLDSSSGAGTSAPVPSTGSAAQAGLVATAVQFSSSGASRRIRLIEDLVLESPSPLGLLDPPKDRN